MIKHFLLKMNRDRILYLKDNFAATPEELSLLQLEGYTDTSVYIQLLQLRGRRSEEALYFHLIEEECGKAACDVRKELAFIRSSNPPAEISMETYFKYGAYTLNVLIDEKALTQWIDKLSRYFYLRDYIIRKIEEDWTHFPAFEKETEEARNLLAGMLSGGRKKELIEAIKDIHPDLMDNTEEYDKVAVDMELSVDVLGFVPEEYVSYHFREKTVPERLEYVSDRLRKKVSILLNSDEGRDILNNKYLAYQTLKPLYGRKIRRMNAEKGFTAFAEAFQENSVLVKKNNFQSLGKEIEKIEVTENTDNRALYERLAENGKYYILEDLIIPHPELKRLNPASVNTIRMVTFLDGEEPVVLDTFLRVGRKDSFVDNGGSGGIFVHLNPAEGITDSHGIDERGFVYELHPDHSYRFCGISMPLWNEAVKTAKKAALTIPGARYVGWDIVCTEDKRWIIVEGNSMTMYIGQQATVGIGKRRALMDAIHYEELT